MPSKTSPYTTNFVQGQIDYDLNPKGQMMRYKTEERDTHIAPNTLPYEFGQLPMYYGDIIANAMEALAKLRQILSNPNIKNKKKLFKLYQNTEKIVTYLVKNVDSTLVEYTIGGKKDEEQEKIENYLDSR